MKLTGTQGKRTRLVTVASSLLIACGSIIGIIALSTPAGAAVVPNRMLCEPDTGWCYQTNPPVNNSQPHYCQWDYQLSGLYSGMWYTGCDTWGPDIH